jgi:hypothetical protein
LVRSTTAPLFGGILSIKVSDGSIVKFIRYGDVDTLPLALTVNRLDRLAFLSKLTSASSSSVYLYDNTITSDMLIISQWDSYLNEAICDKYAFDRTNSFTSVNWLSTASAANLPKYRTASWNGYGVFDVNNQGSDSTASNAMVSMLSMSLSELGTTCTTDGKRITVPLQVAAQVVKLPTGSLSFPHNPICYYDNVIGSGGT